MDVKPLIASIVILTFLLFILFGLAMFNSGGDTDNQTYNITINIRNIASTPKTIQLESGKTIFVNPGDKAEITVPSSEILTVQDHHPDGKIKTNKIRVNDQQLSEVFLGDASYGTNLTSRDGILENNSHHTVRFIEVGSDGRRWHVATLPPGERSQAKITDGSKWQVVSPERENIALANIKVRKDVEVLSYDGEKINIT